VRTVEHDGDRYLLVKRSGESSLVRDPETGTERYLDTVDSQFRSFAVQRVSQIARPACQRPPSSTSWR